MKNYFKLSGVSLMPPLFYVVFLAFVILPNFVNSLCADVTLPRGLGPVANPVTVRVLRGGEVAIKLSASMKGSFQAFEYSIFEVPDHGSLSSIIKDPSGLGASVKYQSDPKSSVVLDRFKFRARNSKGKYSAPATVQVIVNEGPSKLDLPKSLDFGKVVINESRTILLSILNRSALPFSAPLKLPEHFSSSESNEFLTIKPGGRISVPIRFYSNQVSGKFETPLIIRGQRMIGSTVLRGESIAPYKVDKDSVVLTYNRKELLRTAKIRVVNQSSSELKVEASSSDGLLLMPRILNLEPGKLADLSIIAPASNVGPISGIVELRGNSHSEGIRVKGLAVPAHVLVNEGQHELIFEGVFGTPIQRSIMLRNEGGEVAFLSVSLPPPFRVLEAKDSIELRPKSNIELHLELIPDRVGEVNETLVIDGGESPIEIALRGAVGISKNLNVQKKSSQFQAKQTERQLNAKRDSINQGIPVERTETLRNFVEHVPTVSDIRLIKRGKRSLMIGWGYPDGAAKWDFVVETRIHRFDETANRLIAVWVELGGDYLKISSNGTEGIAEISGLQPDGQYTFRVITESEDGFFSRGSAPYRIKTKRSLRVTPLFWIGLLGGGGFLICCSCLVFKKIQFLRGQEA